MYVLDTNVVSELRRPRRSDPMVRSWVRRVPLPDLFTTSINLMELRTRALRLIHRQDQRGRVIEDWIENHVVRAFKGRILAIDEAVGMRCAELHVPISRPYRDSLIAAAAMVHRMTVVTRNLADFEPMGVATLNPWEPQPATGGPTR